MLKSGFLLMFLLMHCFLHGQRTYRASSVLSSGNWFRISVKEPGVYKVDIPLMNSMGLNADGVPSASIRLFGNGGQMLPENCSEKITDDLRENAIEMIDGGDGNFNGQDYFLFYAPGPHSWSKDSVNRRFHHVKNIYSDESYYYLTVGGTGLRVDLLDAKGLPAAGVSSFNERYYHELDSVNFLSSGKEWYGEEFSNAPGHLTSRNFSVPFTNLVNTEPATLVSDCIARSVGSTSRFLISLNNIPVSEQSIEGVSAVNIDVFARSSELSASFIPGATLSIGYSFQPQSPGAQGWLNWFELYARKKLAMNKANQMLFRDWNSVGPGMICEFILQDANAATQVWDVTDFSKPRKLKISLAQSELKFVNDCSILHEYIAFSNTGYLIPSISGKINNQDLHALPPTDLLVITSAPIIEQAQRLAAYHQERNNLKVQVVTAEQVYNEFASGSPDPTAIRDFVKMYYDRADRDTSKSPRYLLLFGDASYDYKNRVKNNSNLVPAYQSSSSLDPLGSFTSDDYFGLLDDNEDINSLQGQYSLDIGIGRIPAKNAAEAQSYVDKLINYAEPTGIGAWRNRLTFIADDEDFNLHFHDAEVITETAAATNAVFLHDKIYLDAFPQESNASGNRYPLVNLAIKNKIENGTLILNYNGHGGNSRLAEEVVLDEEQVSSWNNPSRLPLFITATCDFAPYDNPGVNSLGENILLREKTGAIALMTTTRLVFAYSNRLMNRNYLLSALRQKADGTYMSLGEAVKTAKNITFDSQGDIVNNLKFTLLGDPALTLNFPAHNVKTTTINGKPVNGIPDTLKSAGHYTIEGVVVDHNGNTLSNFDGNVFPVIYDKSQSQATRGNDPGSYPEDFQVQPSVLFRGKAEVKAGRFTFSFIVPQDIGYRFGNGRISYYAENGLSDANGSFTDFVVGGTGGITGDKTGPVIRAFLNDQNFKDGDLVGQSPLLIAQLSDSSGINISGDGIGHDIVGVLDGDPGKAFVLNEYFQSDLGTFQKGTLNFRLPILEDGIHSLKLKAWDAANNSNEATIKFRVLKNLPLSVFHVFSFPNPFTSKTIFRVEHDLDAQNVKLFIRIFTLSGKLVKSIEQTINTSGGRSCDIEWNGRNDDQVPVQKGLYVYVLGLETASGSKTQRSGKLVKF